MRIFLDYLTLSCAVMVVADVKPYMKSFFAGYMASLESFSDPMELSTHFSCNYVNRNGW